MSAFVVIVSILWITRIAGNVLSYAKLWWLKEYRFDRMFIHLRTKQGKQILFIPFHFYHVSPKSILLILLTFLLLAFLYMYVPMTWWLAFLVVDLLTFPVTGLVVSFLTVPTIFVHEWRIWRATSVLRSHTPMMVIGVTGSYGKTSTKEYLSTILSTKYKVLKTEASKNSLIGIAEVVLHDLRPDTEVFVVEMGAYKRGEIARMSEMVRPQIGIVTAINPQHQDLFGSIETTMKAKYELIEGLSGHQIAIINMDNVHVRQMSTWAQNEGRDVWFFTLEKQSFDPSKDIFFADDIRLFQHSIAFTLRHKKEAVEVEASVIGAFQAGNITAAIAAAVAAGMSLAQSADACRHIKPVEKMMQPIRGINGSTFIDDTFNNNPDAAIAAISYLGQAKGRKFLVFQPMIELGKYADQSHEEVGKVAGAVCDEIILTNSNFVKSFSNGVHTVNNRKEIHILHYQQAVNFIKSHVHEDDVVLFKGKEAEGVLKSFYRHLV